MRGPQFAGEPARREWTGVIRSAQQAWSTIELVSVSAGLRPSARVDLEPSELTVASRDASGVGLTVTPLAWTGKFVRCAVSHPSLARAWHAASAESHDELIGQLLGFPACCRESFQRLWVEKRVNDQAPYTGAFAGPWESNVLFRHIGVRAVPHLPCSGDCAETLSMARALLDAGRKAGADVDSIERILRLGASYDALNGVAIVDAGAFRFMHGTDVGAFKATRAPQPGTPVVSGPPTWEDNGFDTHASMVAAHEPIRSLFGSDRGQSLLDLGCGDGALADSLSNKAVGCEIDPARAERGRERHPDVLMFTDNIARFVRDLERVQKFDVTLLMPGRLLELPEDERATVLAHLRRVSKRVMVYAYGDWLAKYKGLAALAAEAGLPVWGGVVVGASGAAQAAWVREDY